MKHSRQQPFSRRRSATGLFAGSGRTAFGTLVASAAFSGLASDAQASDLDARLRVIHDALRPRLTAPRRIVQRAGIAGGPQQSATATFDIPRGPLAEVASALARQAGVQISLTNESLGTIESPGVTGAMSLNEALDAILVGTNVTLRTLTPTSFLLDLPSVSESVSVTGTLETPPTVASPKYAAVPLRDIPQTIEVIPREAMEAQGVTTLSEALRNVPGITMQAGEGGGASSTAGDMFNMRGFNASNSLFVDNVRDDGLVSRDVFNLEQVEVFMGPTGSDVGRGTAAGYVNMQTKTPHLPAAAAFGTLGFRDRRSAPRNNRRQPPASSEEPGQLAGQVGRAPERALAGQRRGRPGRGGERDERRSRRPSALGSATPTRVIASAQFLRQDNLPDYGIPGAAWHDAQLAPTTVQATNPVDQSNYYGSPALRLRPGRPEHRDGAPRTRSEPAVDAVESDPLQQDRARSHHQHGAIAASFVPATETVTIARQGNVRENSITSNQTTLAGRLMTGASNTTSPPASNSRRRRSSRRR